MAEEGAGESSLDPCPATPTGAYSPIRRVERGLAFSLMPLQAILVLRIE